jgi:hypothetical protein
MHKIFQAFQSTLMQTEYSYKQIVLKSVQW